MTEQVSPLRQRIIDDMTIRNMSPNTQKAYIRAVKNFSRYFGKSPDKLNFEDVRKYQLGGTSTDIRRVLALGTAQRNCADAQSRILVIMRRIQKLASPPAFHDPTRAGWR